MDIFEKMVGLPPSVSAYGWIPFSVAIVFSFLFSFGYVRYFWSKNEKDKCTAATVILGIAISLLATLLLPVDVFLVSFMKNSDGSFKEWATNATRETLESSVTYAYYSIYGVIFFYSFFVLPLVYFTHEERDDDAGSKSVLLRAFVYTLIFVLIIAAILVIGVVIPFKHAPDSSNSTEWDKIEFLVNELSKNRGKDALSFVVHILTLYGMLNLILYTGVGMACFPITSIKGFRSLEDEDLILSGNQASTQSKINSLRKKKSQRSLSSREAASLASLEEEESLISRRSLLLESQRNKFCYKLEPILRIVNVVFGVIGIIFSLLLFVSLLIANIDKLQHSLGYQMGYALNKNTLFNPMDYIMVQAQKVFPLDYIIFFSITIYLVMCTVSGMRNLMICFLCVPMYKVRPHRTLPQGLLMLSFILMFTVLAFHILLFAVIPSYTTFGDQKYCKMVNSTCELLECSLDAPHDDCVMTRSSTFLLTFAYKAWFFSFAYFWMTWGFLGIFLVSFIVSLVRSRKSSLEEAIDKDDFDDSYDDPMITA